VRQVDASLLDEWERLEGARALDPSAESPVAPSGPPDITKNQRAFTILIRNACFRLVRAMASRDTARFLQALNELVPDGVDAARAPEGEPWTAAGVERLLAPYWQEHEALLVDADARSAARLVLDRSNEAQWVARQILSDPEANYDWALMLRVDLVESRNSSRLVMSLLTLDNA